MDPIARERTLVIFKPDVVQRQIVGELVTRFERKGFKIVGMKMVWASPEKVGEHYAADDAYLQGVGEKSFRSAQERGEQLPDMTPLEFGNRIRQWNIDYLACGPVVAIVFEGAHVIESVRKQLGTTNPLNADVGSIRGDFSPDSYFLADAQGRTTRTIAHASDSVESANREIPLWFNEDEMFDYETAVDKILYDAGWTGN